MSKTQITNLMDRLTQTREESFNRYLVTVRFNGQVHGAQPADAQQMEAWLRIKLARDEEARLYTQYRDEGMNATEAHAKAKKEAVTYAESKLEEMLHSHLSRVGVKVDAEGEPTEDVTSSLGWTTFFKDGTSCYLHYGTVKACFRDVFTSLGLGSEAKGRTQTRQHLCDVWACDKDGKRLEGEQGERLRFFSRDEKGNETYYSQPEGYCELFTHPGNMPAGKNSAIKRHDYVNRPYMRFQIAVGSKLSASRSGAVIDTDLLLRVLSYMEGNALGANRSLGYGKFVVIECIQLNDNPWTVGKKKSEAEE